MMYVAEEHLVVGAQALHVAGAQMQQVAGAQIQVASPCSYEGPRSVYYYLEVQNEKNCEFF